VSAKTESAKMCGGFFSLWVTARLWAVARKKAIILFYSANLANYPELLFFNPKP
jgi:hypothetical protein